MSGFQWSAASATLVGAGIGALSGFLTAVSLTWWTERKKREQFLVGISRDIERCQGIALITAELPELLNPISFPFIRDVANGSYVHLFTPEERGALLNIHYLLENFLRYQEPEMQIVLDWIRDPQNGQTHRDRYEALQNAAIASLETALRDYARHAYRLLKKQGHYRAKMRSSGEVPLQGDGLDMEPISPIFRSFNEQLAHRIVETDIGLTGYEAFWIASTSALVIRVAHDVLTIPNITKEFLETATPDAVEQVFHSIQAWDRQGRGVKTVEEYSANLLDPAPSMDRTGDPKVRFVVNILAWLFQRPWIIRMAGLLWNQPWLVLGGTYILWRIRDHLPLISRAYVLSGVGGALLVASVGVPLLKVLQPAEAMQAFFELPILRAAVLQAHGVPMDYVHHPEVVRASEEAIRNNSGIVHESLMKALSHTRWSIVTGLAAFLTLPWDFARDAFVQWVCLFVPIAFAAKAVEEQWCMLVVKTVAEFFGTMLQNRRAGGVDSHES